MPLHNTLLIRKEYSLFFIFQILASNCLINIVYLDAFGTQE